MALSEAIVNKIKVLLYENKKDEAEALLIAEAGISQDEANNYIARLEGSITKNSSGSSIPKSKKIAPFTLMGIGFVMWGFAIYFFVDKDQQINNSYLTQGVVIDFIIDEGFAPIISYEAEGTPYKYISTIYSTPPAYELDEVVEIYVDKGNPEDVIINSFINKWLIVTIFASFGLVFDLLGLVVLKLKSSGQSSGIDLFDSQEDRMIPFDD